MDFPLSVALGKSFLGVKDLTWVHVPDGLSKDEALAMVDAANQATGFDPSYAFLVCDDPDPKAGANRPEVSIKKSIRYREGKHVAVVYGRRPDLPSFHNTFQESLGQSFPDEAADGISLQRVSEVLVRDLLMPLGKDVTDDQLAKVVESCLAEVRDLYIEGHFDVRSWNSVWFLHCNAGVRNLRSLLTEARREQSGLTTREFFHRYTHAAFGLPTPQRLWRERRSQQRDAKLLNDARGDYWNSAETAENSVRILSFAGRSGIGSILSMSWDGFDEILGSSPNPWLAITEFLGRDTGRIKAFSELDERDFLNPGGEAQSNVPLAIVNALGESLSLTPGDLASPVFVPMVDASDGNEGYVSGELSVVIPLARSIDSSSLTGREVKVVVSPSSQAEWLMIDIDSTSTELFVRGQLKWKTGTGKNAHPFRQLRLSAIFQSGFPASPHLPLKAQTVTVFSFDSSGNFLALAPKKSKGALGRAVVRGFWKNAIENIDATVELKPALQGYQAFVWNSDGNPSYLDRTELPRHRVLPRMAISHFVPTSSHEFISGEHRYRVNSVEADSGQQSALLAAALKQLVTPNRPASVTVDSVRGQYETYAAQKLCSLDASDFLNALGHIAFPADLPGTMSDVRSQDGGAILMSDKARLALQNVDFVSFDFPEFVYGDEVRNFRNAFDKLAVSARLGVEEDDDGLKYEWPSRTSWRFLWQTEQLANYLQAYTEMVLSARRTNNPGLIFWATYPFCISIWDVDSGAGCSSILLSPLHPIRLSWLAGVENVLANSTDALNFLGSIEGWNFPTAGPGSRVEHKLLAVPCDSGEGQLFASWGMLVKASTSDPTPLLSPTSIGSFDAPGTAVSGLNASAVDAALRSFRKMHPHVTTLTVDLSGNKAQPRLTEIDSAVLKMAVNWKDSGQDGLLGGIRVLDSVNRLGSPPRAELTRLVRDNPDLLFTWSRYNPKKVPDRACSVRFLQDSSSVIRSGDSDKANGTVGQVPLRRFEANSGILSESFLNNSYPGINPSAGWQPFTKALAAIETRPVVSSGISRGTLSNKSASWTVMGETYLSPSTIAALMGNEHHGDQMLWEWRPPLLDEGPVRALLEKRPFVSVARVPRAFSRELDRLLRRACPAEETGELRRQVMTTLGSRGVGLSSLLAMGGTQVAGAIGFYLALRLFDQTASETSNRLVVPIDAADYFLRTLADGAAHAGLQRRADLLILDLSDEGLTMTPVEIKAYGLQSKRESNVLPHPTSSDLNPALHQLRDSHGLLLKVQELSESLKGSDAILWRNSLAALVEVAAKLSPRTLGSVPAFVRRMSALIEGNLPLTVGRPILTYFSHNARTDDGRSYYVGPVGGSELDASGLLCDVEAGFTFARAGDEAFTSNWQAMVRSSFGSAPTDVEVEPSANVLAAGVREGSNEQTPEVPASQVDSAVDAGGQSAGAEKDGSAAGSAQIAGTGEIESVEDRDEHPTKEPEEVTSPISSSSPEWGVKGEGVRIRIGSILDSVGNASADFWPSNTGLNQPNIGVVGDLGTGKTELIKALIYEIRRQVKVVQPGVPTSMLVFDYKGDFQQQEFLDRVGGLVLDPHQIPLNVFLPVTNEYSRRPYQQGAALVDTFKRIFSGIGPRQMSLLNQAVRESFGDADTPPTLADVRTRYIQLSPDPDSVTSILDTFVFGEIFSSRQEDLRSFDEILEGRVVVLALNKLGQDSNTKNSLVALFLNLYHDYMLRLGILPFVPGTPTLRHLKSFLLVDEAVNIMRYEFQVLEDIMLKGRGAGIGVMLASQYLSHFRATKTNYLEPLRTWFIHKIPSLSTRELAAIGVTEGADEVALRVPALGNHQVFYKSFGFDQGRFVRVTPYYELVRE